MQDRGQPKKQITGARVQKVREETKTVETGAVVLRLERNWLRWAESMNRGLEWRNPMKHRLRPRNLQNSA